MLDAQFEQDELDIEQAMRLRPRTIPFSRGGAIWPRRELALGSCGLPQRDLSRKAIEGGFRTPFS